MFIEELYLNQFRNYEKLELKLDSGTNIFFGDNAQGKTNILEAAYLCGTSKSHRGSRDKDMIRFGQSEAHIRMKICREDLTDRLDMHLKLNQAKGIAVNQVPLRKAADLMGIVNMVFFSPEDLNIIKEGPAYRRKFIDTELCQLDRIYLSDLGSYNRALSQRNKLLKDIYYKPELISTMVSWDEQLVKFGKRIIDKRQAFVESLMPIIQNIHSDITNGREKIEIMYEPDILPENFEKKIQNERDHDLKMKSTGVGPHRDDLSVIIDGVDVRKFGSQGQQRSAALSLKLSELELVRKMVREDPVLLLDDVLSELDNSRQQCLLNHIYGIQTFITCTGLDEFVRHRFDLNKVFQVTEGQVRIFTESW